MEPRVLEDFAAAIRLRFGHQQEVSRQPDLARLLERRMEATGYRQYEDYRRLLETTASEWEVLAPLLTVPETYFFRLPDQFHALADDVLPKLIRDLQPRQTLRILSAGCASGEEAYSLRILLQERFPQLDRQRISITGVDLSEPALEKAKAGLYSEWSLRATSLARREANFTRVGKLYRLNDAVREGVHFRQANLLSSSDAIEPAYDIIFCRNVLIYFAEDAVRLAIARLTQRLAPGGYLFLGSAESLRGVSRNFHLCHTGGAFYYRRREHLHDVETIPEAARPPAHLAGPPSTVAARPRQEQTWFDSIGSSSTRLATLMPTGRDTHRSGYRSAPELRAKPASSTATQAVPEPTRPQRFFALVTAERFADALALLDSAPAEALAALPAQPGRPVELEEIANLHLLRASMLTNLGRYADAERECRLMFEVDELNAGAHFLYGLCREQAGQLTEAEEHMATASFLDPGFSMPHLHRGLIARRRHDDAAARASFTKALGSIEQEDSARLAILGGGFSRESLRQLCQRELKRLGQP